MNASYITEANKLSSSGAWVWLLEITTGSSPATLRYTNNNANVTWSGNVYTKMPFVIEDVSVSISGAFPEYELQIGDVDVDGILRGLIKSADGLVGSTIRLMVVHSDHLDVTTAAIDEYTEVLSCENTATAIVFKIGMPTLLSRRFPRDRYSPGFCRHRFGGSLCQYGLPDNTLVSSQVSFVAGDLYDEIRVADGGLLDIFSNVPGHMDAPGDLISNGNFETITKGTLTGWSGIGGHADDWDIWGGTAVSRELSVQQAKYDSHSALIQCNVPDGGLSQYISVTEGKKYSISCWVYVLYSTGESNSGVRLGVITRAVHARRFGLYGGWNRLTVSGFTANSDILTVYIGGHGRAFFDGVSVVEGESVVDYTIRSLDADTGFVISGSEFNDGHYLANNYHHVHDAYVRVERLADYTDRLFIDEAAGEEVTLQLGYSDCDHTLTACRIRDNSQNFGGSPGVRGGVYG